MYEKHEDLPAGDVKILHGDKEAVSSIGSKIYKTGVEHGMKAMLLLLTSLLQDENVWEEKIQDIVDKAVKKDI